MQNNDTHTVTDVAADEPPIIVGSREQLLHLLAEAAEIEHTLMCCYLYAAFSLKDPGDSGLNPEEARAVGAWRKTIMDVAIEEMGHLLIVANLTVALGGRPHFGRPNFPIPPGYFPSRVVVRLAGFSKETLDHFIFLERPQGSQDVDDSEEFRQDGYRREQAVLGIMPSAQDYTTIGHLYEAIRLNVDQLSEALGEENLFIGPAERQLTPPVITLPGLEAIRDARAARAAIDTVVDQGEGSREDGEQSHYRSFVAIAEEFAELVAKNAAFVPAWPVADNPVMRRPVDPGGRVYIDCEESARILDFACASYGLLLRLMVQCFGQNADGVVQSQERLLDAAFVLMHVVGRTGTALARLPASASASGTTAGMSFTMLRGVEPLISGKAERHVLKEQLERLAEAAASLTSLGIDHAELRDLARTFAAPA